MSTAAPAPEPWDIGRPVAGYRWTSPGATGVLLLQHGFGEYALRFATQYQQLVGRLVDLGFDVYAFDMRGHGSSPGRRGVVDVRQAVDDHRAARARLSDSGRRVFAFGHSLGGLVTAASIADDPDEIAGVVLTSPALPRQRPRSTRALLHVLHTIAPFRSVPTPAADVAGLSRVPEQIDAVRRDRHMYTGNLSNRTAATALSVADRLWQRAPEWTVPTLILHGTSDNHTDHRASIHFYERISSPDKTVQIEADGRHELLNDVDGERVLHDVLAWLQSRTDVHHQHPSKG